MIFPRATSEKPQETREIKPHPYGIELGMLIKMMVLGIDMLLPSMVVDNWALSHWMLIKMVPWIW